MESDSAQMMALAALANGIIPADGSDAGADCVDAGRKLAERISAGVNTAIYEKGLMTAEGIAREKFGAGVSGLNAAQVHELLGVLREVLPGFFKQLRMDVSGLYLSDPEVWGRIGFPGPSTASGGYADFDRPQMVVFGDALRRVQE